MPFYWDIDNFDADIVQASLDSRQVVYKYINPVSFIVAIQQSFLADEDILVVVCNTGLKACYDSGLLDEHIYVIPYCVHYDRLADMIMIVVLLVYMWLYLFMSFVLCVCFEHVVHLWKTKTVFA